MNLVKFFKKRPGSRSLERRETESIKWDREYKIIDDAKNILTEAIGVEVDTSLHILLKLEEAFSKFNEDTNGQENLIEKVENKFDNKVLEHIAQQIAIQ